MKEITIASKQSQFTSLNFEQIMHAWRERVPNDWDSIAVWSDVLKWRGHMYNFIVKTFQSVPKIQLNRLHDTHWTTLKLASVIQSNNNVELANDIVKSLLNNESPSTKDLNMIPSYIFQKLKNEVSISLNLPKQFESSVIQINNTDLSKFEPWQIAELYVIKGRLLEKMGGNYLQDAMKSFSTALTICNDQGKLWIEWAKFYDRQLYNVTKGLVPPMHSSTQALGCRPLEGHSLEYAVSAISTYLHAVSCDHDPATRLVLARIIRLLQCDDRSGRLSKVFANHIEQTPIWSWITWVPQLLHSLSRPEAIHAFNIIYGLSNMFPQAVYHSLRCYVLEQRDKKLQKDYLEQQLLKKRKSETIVADSSTTTTSTTSNSSNSSIREKDTKIIPFKKDAIRLGVQTQDQVENIARTKNASDTLKESLKYMSKTGHLMQIKAGTTYSEMLHLPDGGDRIKPPHEYAEELMAFLRQEHPSLASETEVLFSELITKFKPGPEEELLSAVLVLQQKCFHIAPKNVSFDKCIASPAFLATLMRVGERYFKLSDRSSLSTSSSLSSSTSVRPKVRAFCEEFRDKYFDDFVHVKDGDPPRTLLDVANALEHWKTTLQDRLDSDEYRSRYTSMRRTKRKHTTVKSTSCSGSKKLLKSSRNCGIGGSGCLSLHKKSSILATFTSDKVEMPGQYFRDIEPTLSLHTTISSIDPYYEVVYRPGLNLPQSRVTFVGNDGISTSFLVQYCVPIVTPTDIRSMQLHHLTNRILSLDHGCRSRNLSVHPPIIVPIAPRVRLSRENNTFVSFTELYERDCERRGISCLAPTIAMHRIESIAGSSINTSDQERTRLRLNEYENICDKLTNPGVLTQYLSDVLPDVQSRWKVRSEMTKQWAITSVLSYSFYIEQRDPSKFVFACDTGDVLSLNFRPAYHRETGQLIGMDHVPFRLTPSLQHLMTPIGIHGTLAESMMATASCLHANLAFIEDYASLFFSGDMIPWHRNHKSAIITRNAQIVSSSTTEDTSPKLQKVLNLAQVVDRNVDQVLQRIREIAPLDSAPKHDRSTCLSNSESSSGCINQAVHELIKVASNPVYLSRQDVLWQPFF